MSTPYVVINQRKTPFVLINMSTKAFATPGKEESLVAGAATVLTRMLLEKQISIR